MVVGRLPSFYEGLFSEAMLVLGTVKLYDLLFFDEHLLLNFLFDDFLCCFLIVGCSKWCRSSFGSIIEKKSAICLHSNFQHKIFQWPKKKNRRNLLLENFTVKISLSFQVMSSSHSQCAQQEEDHLANVMKGLGDGFLKLLEVSAGCLVTKICSHVTKLDGKIKKNAGHICSTVYAYLYKCIIWKLYVFTCIQVVSQLA